MTIRRRSLMILALLGVLLIGVSVYAQIPTVEVPIDGMKVINFGSTVNRVVVGTSDTVRAQVVTSRQIMLFGLNAGSTTLHVWTEQGLRQYRIQVANISGDGMDKGSEALLREVGSVDAEGNELRVFVPEYRDVSEYEQYISELLSDKGKIILSDAASEKIFVFGPETLLDKIEDLLDEIDVPGEEESYTRRIVLDNRSANQMQEKVVQMLSEEGRVIVDEETNSLLVVDLVSRVKQIERYLNDVDVETTRQVRIEARFVEITDEASRELGIDWEINGTIDGDAFEVGLVPAVNQSAGLQSSFSNNDLTANIKALESKDLLDLISSPNVMTRNQQEAVLEILNEQSYLAGCNVDQTEGAQTTTPQVETTEDGITLRVTPLIGNNDVVQLDVVPELRLVSFDQSLQESSPCGTIRFPQTDRRRAELNVALRDGQTLVIGGLNRNEQTTSSTGVPFLSRIPALGHLFKQQTDGNEDKDITIFLTAHIVSMTPDQPTDQAESSPGEANSGNETSNKQSIKTSSDVLLD